MSNRHQHKDLEIEVDPTLQRAVWRWQRRAWVVMGIVILAALSGLFGDSRLFRLTANGPAGTLHVKYDWVGRREAEQNLMVVVPPDVEGHVDLWVSREYLDAVGIESISPRPARELAGMEGTTFTFVAEDAGQPVSIAFRLVPRQFGLIQARMRPGRGTQLSFRQFIYP